MDDSLGNALVIEMRDLFAEDEVFEQRRTAEPGLERVLVVCDRHALVGGQRSLRRINPYPVERRNRLVDAYRRRHRCRASLSCSVVTVLAPTIGSRGVTEGPASGPSSTCGSYSEALSGLKGRLTDSSSVPTSLRASASLAAAASQLRPVHRRSFGYCERQAGGTLRDGDVWTSP